MILETAAIQFGWLVQGKQQEGCVSFWLSLMKAGWIGVSGMGLAPGVIGTATTRDGENIHYEVYSSTGGQPCQGIDSPPSKSFSKMTVEFEDSLPPSAGPLLRSGLPGNL